MISLNIIQKKNFFIFHDFTFCSLSIPLSRSNQYVYPIEKRTIFAFECCNAKFFGRHSYEYSKNEIFLIPTQLQFIGYLDRKNDFDIIQLKEINESFPLIKLNTLSNQSCPITSIDKVSQQIITITKSINITPLHIFSENPKLKRLISLHQPRSEMNLTYQKLTAKDIPITIEQGIVGLQCTKLILNNTHITTECLSILVPAFHNNTTLKELHLNETGISDEDMRILTQTLALNNCFINTLSIRNNPITDKRIQYLIEMFKMNTTLMYLYLP